ncbi:MAG TPA: hypothetical protein VL988_14690 [Solirubrobacteraceae bacterium]|nr:hypothetical protein [Solirubrobacteraceae bacterium]
MTRGSMGACAVLLLCAAALLGAGEAAAAAPLNATAPSIGGSAVDGKHLKAARGTWGGAKPFAYAYQWSRCDASGNACAELPTATKPSYKLTDQDVGRTLRVAVTVTDAAASSASSTSAPSAVVQPAALSKRKRPSITGSTKDGQLLTVGTGTWKGTQPQSFAYQWQACTKSGACSDIEGATGSSYRVASAQIGRKLRAIVTATNAAGEASAASKTSKPATAGPPVSVSAPAIEGSLQEGQTLSANPGGWAGTGPISYAFQWLRCSAAGGGCAEIPGATGSTYTAEGADLASNLAVVVTASGPQGSVAATSPETQPILGILPTSSVLPSISGVLQDGQLLSVATGAWSGTQPIAYAFQWQLCNALGQACESIEGATGSSLKLDPSEIGRTLAVVVTATNSAGSASATSPVSGLIAGILPANTAPPAISGVLKTGQLLSVTNGTWSGSAPISYAYQWQLCNALGGGCADISKATEPGFKLSLTDVGLTLRAIVTATNGAGSVSQASPVTGLIAGLL